MLALFPLSHWHGVMLPAVLLVVGISLALTFVGTVMMASNNKNRPAPSGAGGDAKKSD